METEAEAEEGTTAGAELPTPFDEEKSRLSLASSIEESNLLHYSDSKSGHSRLSGLSGMLGPASAIINKNNNVNNTDRQRANTRGNQPQQQLLSPLTEEDHYHLQQTPTPTVAESDESGGAVSATARGSLLSTSHKNNTPNGSISSSNNNNDATKSTTTHQPKPKPKKGILRNSTATAGPPLTLSQHLKNPDPPPPPPPNPPPSKTQSHQHNQHLLNNTNSDDDAGGTTFTVNTNATHRTFPLFGNVASETLHTSNLRSHPSSKQRSPSSFLLMSNADSIHFHTDGSGGGIGRRDIDQVAAWAIHLALIFFASLVLAAVVLTVVVMRDYGFITFVLLMVILSFGAGLAWFVDQAVLSKNPNLRPIRRRILTVVKAAQQKIFEEYHLFVQDWKEHQLLLTEGSTFAGAGGYTAAEDAAAPYFSAEGTPTSTVGARKKKKSRIFRLVKPFLGLKKKILLRRRGGTGAAQSAPSAGTASAGGGGNDEVEAASSSYRPPPPAFSAKADTALAATTGVTV